jgi:hypothetical protein
VLFIDRRTGRSAEKVVAESLGDYLSRNRMREIAFATPEAMLP